MTVQYDNGKWLVTDGDNVLSSFSSEEEAVEECERLEHKKELSQDFER